MTVILAAGAVTWGAVWDWEEGDWGLPGTRGLQPGTTPVEDEGASSVLLVTSETAFEDASRIAEAILAPRHHDNDIRAPFHPPAQLSPASRPLPTMIE